MEEINDRIDESATDAPDEQETEAKSAYELPDVQFPDDMQGMVFDKQRFGQILQENGIAPEVAVKLWEAYTKESTTAYQKVKQEQERNQLAQIQESLSVGDGLHLKPEEAQVLIDKISTDMSHPYWNERASPLERDKAVALMNRLYEIRAGRETTVEGYLTAMHDGRQEQIRGLHGSLSGSGDVMGRSSKSGERAPDNIHSTYQPTGFGEKDRKSGYGQRIEDTLT